MPIRGRKVGRSGRFDDIVAVITSHGFVRTTRPGYGPAPGFYYFGRSGYLLQILNGRKVSITRPDQSVQIVSARRLVNLDSALDVIVMDIEEAEEN